MRFPTGMLCVRGLAQPFHRSDALSNLFVFAANAQTANQTTDFIATFASDNFTVLWLDGSANPPSISFDQAGIVTRSCTVQLGQQKLVIPIGAALEELEESKYKIVGPSATSITFGDQPIFNQQLLINFPPHAQSGCLQFTMAAPSGMLNSSIRYFYTPTGGSIQKFIYNLFPAPIAAATAAVTLDPSHPFDKQRSFAALPPNEPNPSCFWTVTGRQVSLTTTDNSNIVFQWDPQSQSAYETLDGEWTLSTGPGASGPMNLMCGLSGLEYAKAPENSTLKFVTGGAAYAPGFQQPSVSGAPLLTQSCTGSTQPVTTAWVYVEPPQGPVGLASDFGYYSQPNGGGLFQIFQSSPFLQVLPVETAGFPASTDPSFPMVPYAGATPETSAEAKLMRTFEIEVLSPARSNAIFAINWPPGGPESACEQPPAQALGITGPLAVTPQGMLSEFSEDLSDWRKLVLATTLGTSLELRDLCTKLKAALMTNQLFLVISNPLELQACCTVLFPGLSMGGWTFNLEPTSWRTDTVMILKFAEQSLETLVNDLPLWSGAGSGFNDGVRTQQVLKDWIATAKDNANQPEFDYFLKTVLGNWNGIIFANVQVPPNDFPPQLRALTVGIDMTKLAAHHLGINLSPVDVSNGRIQVSDSSVFGLIFYNDPHDLAYNGAPYDYKVLSLRVLFANSDIASFSSSVELLVGALFGERSTLLESVHGDNLILNGVWERHGTEDSYTFTEVGADTFKIESKVLENALITKAQFITLDAEPGSTLVSSRFILSGSLRFKKLEELDVFGFGPETPLGAQNGLQFSNLFVSMQFDSASATPVKDFAFEAGQTVFDLSMSVSRTGSLYSRFPLRVTAMVQGSGKAMPASMGFIPLVSPLTSGALGNPWFGLEMSMSLGSQGGLAAKAGFYATFLAAWAPSIAAYNVAIGLRLPGAEGGSKSLTIQGPLKLDIGGITMLYNKDEKSYLMRFNDIALGFLGLKFPPNGRTNVLLFGDPNPDGPKTTLGWYAAYLKNKKPVPPTPPPPVVPPILPPKDVM